MFGEPAERLHGQAVEGATPNGWGLVPDQARRALQHFLGGSTREREQDDVPWGDLLFFDEPSDSVHQGVGLARASTRDHQLDAIDGGDGG